MTGVTIAQIGDNVTIVQGVEAAGPPGVGGGVTDHGALTGLADDDHTQYHNDARGDARYQPLDSDLTAIAALSTTSFGRALLELADAAAGRTALGLGSLATASTITTSEITDGTIVNADISASAAIALSKLATTGTPSSSNFLRGDGAWSTATDSGAVQKSTVTAKGDLIAATGSAAVTNVAVGANNKVLLADSTQSAGVAWGYAVPSLGDPKAGSTTYYTQPGFYSNVFSTQNMQADVRCFYPFLIPTSMTADQIAIEQTTAAAAGKLFRIGLIAADKWWQPTGSVLMDSGTFAADGANGVKTYTPGSPVALPPGRYLGIIHTNGIPVVRTTLGSFAEPMFSTSLGSNSAGWAWRVSLAFGAIDTTAWDTVSFMAQAAHAMWLRFSDPAP